MRFVENGPDIPDELLLARDDGQVVFFCGAGVSRARAKLADFYGLADAVIADLGVTSDHPVHLLLTEAKAIGARTGISGLIAADRVFGQLEREFESRDIVASVAKTLKVSSDVDLSAHRFLIDLATTKEGLTRIVTTNFDLLFEKCAPELKSWQPPKLPDPTRAIEIDGIIHLHGCVTRNDSGAAGEEFVLSSSDFGRAYLADGWATRFIKDIIERYTVVFIGYSADDPPVQYLFEALNKAKGQLRNVYAFQSGNSSYASALWAYKGIQALAYSNENGHAALWQTLERWSRRATNPDGWYEQILTSAERGPEAMQPFERGQVAHIVSHNDGARRFSEHNPKLGSEWLWVLDRSLRFGRPRQAARLMEQGPYVDPFQLYGLDCDPVPQKIPPEDNHRQRDAPASAWDAFALTERDIGESRISGPSQVGGLRDTGTPELPSRLRHLGVWIAKSVSEPAALWWFAGQHRLHPSILNLVEWSLQRNGGAITSTLRLGWTQLVQWFRFPPPDLYREALPFRSAVNELGWTDYNCRWLASLQRPHVSVKRSLWSSPKPLDAGSRDRLFEIIHRDVEYPNLQQFGPLPEIPNQALARLVRDARQNLEQGIDLENEIGGWGLKNVAPLRQDEDAAAGRFHQPYGISGPLSSYCAVFSRLVDTDAFAAHCEMQRWPRDDPYVFEKLRIWAALRTDFIPAEELMKILLSLSEEAFWSPYNQRDLLLLLAERWCHLDETCQSAIEKRLLGGPARIDGEGDEDFSSRADWSAWERVKWLEEHGIKLESAAADLFERVRAAHPTIDESSARNAVRSMEARGGFVQTITDASTLNSEPLAQVLERARELTGRTDDFLVERDPFSGLASERPARALSALCHAARNGRFEEWAWTKFLYSEARARDSTRLLKQTARRLCAFEGSDLIAIDHALSSWLSKISGRLATEAADIFEHFTEGAIALLAAHGNLSRSGLARSSSDHRDWTTEAINSLCGSVAQAVLKDVRTNDLTTGGGLPEEWLRLVEGLLALRGDCRRYALVLLAHNLTWFHAIDPKWTEKRLLSVPQGVDGDDRDAFWAGYLWSGRTGSQTLFAALKAGLLQIALENHIARRGYTEVLSGMILAGWGSRQGESGLRLVASPEMRELLIKAGEDFRLRSLWQLERWSEAKQEVWNAHETWDVQVATFLSECWPKQPIVRTEASSEALCSLLISDPEHFLDRLELILPLLVPLRRHSMALFELDQQKDKLVQDHPLQILKLLQAVLPEDANEWPYGIDSIFQKLGQTGERTRSQEILVELNRRWLSR